MSHLDDSYELVRWYGTFTTQIRTVLRVIDERQLPCSKRDMLAAFDAVVSDMRKRVLSRHERHQLGQIVSVRAQIEHYVHELDDADRDLYRSLRTCGPEQLRELAESALRDPVAKKRLYDLSLLDQKYCGDWYPPELEHEG